jgi:hypothetical protein
MLKEEEEEEEEAWRDYYNGMVEAIARATKAGKPIEAGWLAYRIDAAIYDSDARLLDLRAAFYAGARLLRERDDA